MVINLPKPIFRLIYSCSDDLIKGNSVRRHQVTRSSGEYVFCSLFRVYMLQN